MNESETTKQRVPSLQALASAQRFLGAFSSISPHFRPRRHLLTARDYRTQMTERFTVRNAVTGVSAPA